jgi:hypothetical protein
MCAPCGSIVAVRYCLPSLQTSSRLHFSLFRNLSTALVSALPLPAEKLRVAVATSDAVTGERRLGENDAVTVTITLSAMRMPVESQRVQALLAAVNLGAPIVIVNVAVSRFGGLS